MHKGTDPIRNGFRTLVLAATAAVVLVAHPAGATDFSGWSHRMKITASAYLRLTTLSDFPLLVVLNESRSGFLYSQFASPSGGDLRFADSATNEIPYEIEKWNSGGSSFVWVKVPALDGPASYIWAYWGNPLETAPPIYTIDGSTWNSGYGAVWHLNETGLTGRKDSTANPNDAAQQGFDGDEGATGLIGGGCRFDGSNDTLYVNNHSSVNFGDYFTCSAWINADKWDADDVIMRKDSDYRFYNRDLGGGVSAMTLKLQPPVDRQINYPISNFTPGKWYHVTATYNRYGGMFGMQLYVNGVAVNGTTPNGSINNSTDPLYIGSSKGVEYYWNGLIDEARLCNVARPTDWIWASYSNQVANSTFCTYSPAEQLGVSPLAIANAAADNITATSGRMRGTLLSQGDGPPNVFICWGDAAGTASSSTWQHVAFIGTLSPGAFSTNILGLTTNETYYYRCFAKNATQEVWATGNQSFATLLPTVQFVNTPYEVDENAGNKTITVSLTGQSAAPISVDYETSDLSAQAGWDYTNRSGTLTWTAYQTGNKSFTVPIIDDAIPDGDESFRVTLSSPHDCRINGSVTADVLIRDNDSTDNVWTGRVVNGWCWLPPSYFLGQQLSAAGNLDNIQFDDNDAISTLACWAEKLPGGNVPANRGWISVYFQNNLPSSVTISSVKARIQHQGKVGESGQFVIHASDDKATTGWYIGSVTASAVNTGDITWNSTEQTYEYDLTSYLNTPTKINNCELVFCNKDTSLGNRVYFDYAELVVEYEAISPPLLNNTGATAIQPNSARLTGQLVAGGPPPEVWVCWGDVNGGRTLTSNWQHVEYVGIVGIGSFFEDIAGLLPNKNYYYTCYAANSQGTAWSDTVTQFTTLPPTVQFNASTSFGAESASPVVLTLSLDQPSTQPMTVQYAATGGTAVNGTDYNLTAGTVGIPAGRTSTNITILVISDSMDEYNDTIVVTLSSPSGAIIGTRSAHTYSIINDDPPPNLNWSGEPYIVPEDGTSIVISVSLAAQSGKPVSAQYRTLNGTAIAGSDFTYAGGTLTWTAGETGTKPFTVFVTDDSDQEGNETFTNQIYNLSNCLLGGSDKALVIIFDDDMGPPILDNAQGADGVTTSSARLNGYMHGTGGAPCYVWIYWGQTDGGTNKGGWFDSEYVGMRDLGPFSANLTGVLSSHTTYRYRCYASNMYGQTWASFTTNFLTGPPTIQFTTTSSSGQESSSPALLEVSLSSPAVYGVAVSVNYTVAGGTAQNGTDYTLSVPGSVSIPIGANSANISIPITPDTTDEQNETIQIGIYGPSGGNLGPNTVHTYTIIDDDEAPDVSFINTPYSVYENGTNITIYVSLAQASAKTATIHYATANGTAVAGTHYTSVSGTFTWNPGASGTQTFVVPIIDNDQQSGHKNFNVILSDASNCAIGDGLESVQIREDDVDQPTATNGGGATDVLWTTARLRGTVADVFPTPAVWIYWGDESQGINTNAWDHKIKIGTLSGAFWADIEGLVAGKTYYYRCHALSWAGESWSPVTNFTTLLPAVSPGQNYYVNDASTNGDLYCTAVGNSGNSGMARNLPLDTVQAVISTYVLNPGDCIWIDTGTYIMTQNITIGTGDDGALGNHVVLRGPTGEPGAVLDRNNPNSTYGIRMSSGTSYIRLENLRITGATMGINVAGTTSVRCYGLEIIDCDVYENNNPFGGIGLWLNNCDTPLVSGGNYYGNHNMGVYASSCNGATIVGTRCYGQILGASGGYGISVPSSSADAVVISNVCYGNAEFGIFVAAASSVSRYNTCYSNDMDGLAVAASGCDILDNVAFGNTRDGISVRTSGLTTSNNVSFANGRHGILNDVVSGQVFSHNLLYDNGGYGLYLDGWNNEAEIVNNTIYGGSGGGGGLYLYAPSAIENANNIIWATGLSNAAIFIVYAPAPGSGMFVSDFNNLYATDSASVGSRGGAQLGTLALWRLSSGGDAGSISADPLFADSANGDFHLQSRGGTYSNGIWEAHISDSPSIDAADPWADFYGEPDYNGLTLNQGVYGNTPEASKTYYTGPFYGIDLSVVPAGAGWVQMWPVATNALYPTNRLMTVWAGATNDNYLWQGWGGSIGGTNNPETFYVDGDMDIEAHFEGVLFIISASAGSGGQISPSGPVPVVAYSNITFDIVPDPFCSIANVVVDTVSRGAVTSWTFNNVTENHSIQAYFNTPTLTIDASAGYGGTIAPSGSVATALHDDKWFIITPEPSFAISDVIVDTLSRGPTNIWAFYDVITNHSIEAQFQRVSWTITASAGTGGQILPNGPVEVDTGSNITFTITTNDGYMVSNVVVDSISRGPTNSWTFTAVSTSHVITVQFAPVPGALTARGTPIAWLQKYGFTGDYDNADYTDPDGDLALTWEEYPAGTVPTNRASVFAVTDTRYTPASNRVMWYATTNSGVFSDFLMYRCTNLAIGTWSLVGSNIPRRATGYNYWWDTNMLGPVPLYYRPAIEADP